MLICVQKIIVQKNRPLSVSKFAMAMRHELRLQFHVADILGGEIFEGVRQLDKQ